MADHEMPIGVDVRLEIVDINTLDQTFMIDVELKSKYEVDQNELPKDKILFTRREWEKRDLFIPQYVFFNSNMSDDAIQVELFEVNDDRSVTHTINYVLTLRHNFLWPRFPFDRQILRVPISSPNFAFKLEVKDLRENGIKEWKFPGYEVNDLKEQENDSDQSLFRRQIKEIRIFAERESCYYIREYFAVILGITFLNGASFGFDPRGDIDAENGTFGEFSERMTVTVTILLTLVAFKFVMNSSLPRSNEATVLDYFMAGAFVLQGLFAAFHLVASFCPYSFCTKDIGVKSLSNDMIAMLIIIGLYLFLALAYMFSYWLVPVSWSKLKKKVAEEEKKEEINKIDGTLLDREGSKLCRPFSYCSGGTPKTSDHRIEPNSLSIESSI